MVSARLLATTLMSAALTSAQYFNSSSVSSSSAISSSSSSAMSSGNSSSIAPTSSIPPTSSSSSAPEETPYLTGSYVDGKLQWELFVPGSLGPWTEVSIAATGEGYAVDTVSILVGDVATTGDVSIDGSSVSASTGENAADGESLKFLYIAAALTDASEFTTDLILSITTPDQVKLVRRAVTTYEFTSTITVPAGSSSSSSSASGSTSVSASSSSEDVTTIWGTSVVTSTHEGTVTSYTTYCPLSTETHALTTVTHTVTSCPGVEICETKVTTNSKGEETTCTLATEVITITHCEGGCTPKTTGTVAPETPITTITLGKTNGGETVTGGKVKTSTNAEGSTVVVVYKTSTAAPTTPAVTTVSEQERSTVASVSSFEGAANKVASGLGLLLPAVLFLF